MQQVLQLEQNQYVHAFQPLESSIVMSDQKDQKKLYKQKNQVHQLQLKFQSPYSKNQMVRNLESVLRLLHPKKASNDSIVAHSAAISPNGEQPKYQLKLTPPDRNVSLDFKYEYHDSDYHPSESHLKKQISKCIILNQYKNVDELKTYKREQKTTNFSLLNVSRTSNQSSQRLPSYSVQQNITQPIRIKETIRLAELRSKKDDTTVLIKSQQRTEKLPTPQPQKKQSSHHIHVQQINPSVNDITIDNPQEAQFYSEQIPTALIIVKRARKQLEPLHIRRQSDDTMTRNTKIIKIDAQETLKPPEKADKKEHLEPIGKVDKKEKAEKIPQLEQKLDRVNRFNMLMNYKHDQELDELRLMLNKYKKRNKLPKLGNGSGDRTKKQVTFLL